MSNIYSVYSDHSNGGVAQIADSLERSYAVLSRHNIGERLEVDFEPQFAIDEEDEVVSDEFDLSMAACPFVIVSERAKDALLSIIKDDVQLFPLALRGSSKTFYGLHSLKCYGLEAVNVDECRSVRHYENGSVINGLVLNSNFEPEANIFTIKGASGIYVTERFKKEVDEQRLNSFEFRLLKRA